MVAKTHLRTPRLSVFGASKTFGVTKVLDDVSLDVAAGEIYGLVGENGSDKSTLIKLLSGYHTPEERAAFYLDGRRFGPPVRPWGWQRDEMSFVHQDLGLVDELSVVDNVRIGRYRGRRFSRLIRKGTGASRSARRISSITPRNSPSLGFGRGTVWR